MTDFSGVGGVALLLLVSAGAGTLAGDAAPNAPWAKATGKDNFGHWADLEITGNGLTVTQRFRWVRPGTFTMGSPASEPGHSASSETQRQVTLSKGFWMADTECTQGLWLAVMGTNPSEFPGDSKDTQKLDLPVDNVSFRDIRASKKGLSPGPDCFLTKLKGLKHGLNATLPTEAQWEHACRAGSTKALYTGDLGPLKAAAHAPSLDAIAWYGGNSAVWKDEIRPPGAYDLAGEEELEFKMSERQYHGPQYKLSAIHHVKLKQPNAWGLYDMLGNVSEIVWDSLGYHSKQKPDTSPVTDPVRPNGKHDLTTIKGGCFWSPVTACRCAFKTGEEYAVAFAGMGFRLCVPGSAETKP